MTGGRSVKLRAALSPRSAREVVQEILGAHQHQSMLGACSCEKATYDDRGPYDGELAAHDRHQAAIVAAELIRLYLIVDGVTVDAFAAEVMRSLGAHRRAVGPARCSCGTRYDETDLFEGGRAEHNRHAAAVVVGQLQVREMVAFGAPVYLRPEAITAALKAMESVTPPPGVSKEEWLRMWGRSALIAGGVAAAVQAMEVLDAAEEPRPHVAAAAQILGHWPVQHPDAEEGRRLSCECGEPLDDYDPSLMSEKARYNLHLGWVLAGAGWRQGPSRDTEIPTQAPFRVGTHP